MATMRVTVQALNKRKYPVTNTADKSNVVGIVNRGFTFDSQGSVTNSVGTWYKDSDDYYYWGLGLELVPDYPSWMTSLNIPEIWKYATGKNVGIAVVDTGINTNNPDLVYSNRSYLYPQATDIKDKDGHGSNCAGIIGAKNKIGNMIGVCPDCDLFICKISDGDSLTEQQATRYADAINWCADQPDIHIISISWGTSIINDKNIIATIQQAVNNAVAKNKIVVCAIGDASHLNDNSLLYPACLDNTIAVGSIPVDNALYPYINPYLTLVTDGLNIVSYGTDSTHTLSMTGTSQSNAMVAGITGLLVQKLNFACSPATIKQILQGVSTMQSFNNIQLPVLNGDLLLAKFK